jgi:hypothetical protein
LLKTIGESILSNLPSITIAILAWSAYLGRKALYNLYVDWFPVGFKIRGSANQVSIENGVQLKVTLWINKRTPDTEIIEIVEANVGQHHLTLAANPAWTQPPKGTSIAGVNFVGLAPGNYSGQILKIKMHSRNRQGSKAISQSCSIF